MSADTGRCVRILEHEHTPRRLRGREATVLDSRVFGTSRRTWLRLELESGERAWLPEKRTETLQQVAP